MNSMSPELRSHRQVLNGIAKLFGFRTTVCLVLLSLGQSGCGSNAQDIRLELSGTVTYQGKPVPGGRILFAPDHTQGNTGVASVADIVNGRFITRSKRGSILGPQQVTIFGTDGTTATDTHDNTLFTDYTTTINVSENNTNFEFEVPSS